MLSVLYFVFISVMASSQGNQSQKSTSSSSGSSSAPSLEPHQPSMEYPITGSTSASGSSGDQPGPSGLQAGPSGLQVKNGKKLAYACTYVLLCVCLCMLE